MNARTVLEHLKTNGTMFTTGQVKHLKDLRPGNIVVESEFMLAVHEVFTQRISFLGPKLNFHF